MRELKFTARAPSNIALIKYMGKKDGSLNLPENESLSMTLDSLCTWAELTADGSGGQGGELSWLPHSIAGANAPSLSEAGIVRILRHVERTRAAATRILPEFGLSLDAAATTRAWTLRTANTFPHSSGIASSASAFAAATAVAALSMAEDSAAFLKAWDSDPAFRQAWSRISRQGSGSSCRSFFGPWVHWDEEEVSTVPADLPALTHFVVLVSEDSKAVSSSEAHQLIKSSPLWTGRPVRVADRAAKLRRALAEGDLRSISRIAWTEAWEMHSLFHTASEPFTYWKPASLEILGFFREYIGGNNPPIVTLDAGPNVHFTVESSTEESWAKRFARNFPRLKILRDQPGRGIQFSESSR